MDNELLQQMRASALRLQPGQCDPITRAWAEQDLRTLRSRYVLYCLRTAFAVIFGAGAGALAGAWAGAKDAFHRNSNALGHGVAFRRPL